MDWICIGVALVGTCYILGFGVFLLKRRRNAKPKQMRHSIDVHGEEKSARNALNLEAVGSVSGITPMGPEASADNGSSSVEMMNQSMEYDVITPNMITPMMPKGDEQNNIYEIEQNAYDEGMDGSYMDENEDDDGDILTGVNTLKFDDQAKHKKSVDVDDILLEVESMEQTPSRTPGPIVAEDEFVIGDDNEIDDVDC